MPSESNEPQRDSVTAADLERVAVRHAEALAERLKTPTYAVSLQPVPAERKQISLWLLILHSSRQLSFGNYRREVAKVLCESDDKKAHDNPMRLPFPGVDPYRLLKAATEAFVLKNCGVVIGSEETGRPPKRTPKALTDLVDSGELGKTIDDANARLPSIDLDRDSVDRWWQDYVEPVNGHFTIPYLAAVRHQLGGVPIKPEPPRGEAAAEDVEGDQDECYGILEAKLTKPCMLELIWSYWHEEGMLTQSINSVCRRFQNVRGPGKSDPLARLDIDPLRPLNNLLWGHIQDEQHRLRLQRRAYEYDHHYGLRLEGEAVPKLRPADSRSKFLEAFHTLLHLCSTYYRDKADKSVDPETFPLLNALKEVHLLLAEGAHNQFGDLPSTARIEMMMQQWLLSRPEMREFLGGRVMVPYPENWMDRVDTMKRVQGWTDVTVRHFRDLAWFGERILLSIRYGDWSNEASAGPAAIWADFWHSDIQGYIHAYRAATGVDLGADDVVDFTPPSVHLRERLAEQRAKTT